MSPIRVAVAPEPRSLAEMGSPLCSAGADAWLVLPSDRLVMLMADLLAAPAAVSTKGRDAGVSPVLPLRALARRILAAGVRQTPHPISSTLRRLLIRQSIDKSIGADGYFGKVRDTAGFPAALSDLVRELKQACVSPDLLESASQSGVDSVPDSRFSHKSEEIVRIYRSYQDTLTTNDMMDEDDLIPAAIDRTSQKESLRLPSTLHVAGFHQFSQSQLALFAALSRKGVGVVIHLVYDDRRPFLFAPSGRTLNFLLTGFGAIAESETPLTAVAAALPLAPQTVMKTLAEVESAPLCPTCQSPLPARHCPTCESPLPALHRPISPPPEWSLTHSPLLAHLERTLFLPDGGSQAADDSIAVLEAPGEYVEAEMIAQRIHRLHAEGLTFGSMAIIVRSVGEYAPRMRCVMKRFGIPLTASTLEPLAQNPAVQFLIRLFELIPGPWLREDLLRVLRSSYLGLSLRSVDSLERRARREGILEGPERWLALGDDLNHLGLRAFLARLSAWRAALESGDLEGQELQYLRRCALSCLSGRSSDAFGHEDDADSFGQSFLPADGPRSRGRLSQNLSAADRAALRAASQIATELNDIFVRQPVRTLPPLAIDGNIPSRAELFAAELLGVWKTATFSVPPESSDCVQLLDAYAASPREFPVVFAAGLLEGSFPRRGAEDPFFRDDERHSMQTAGVPLQTSLEKADEERVLFHRAISAARSRLILTYPRVTGEGKDCLPSFYLDEVRAVIGGLDGRTSSRTLSEVAPLPDEAISLRDFACAVAVAAGDWRRGLDQEFLERCRLYDAMLLDQAGLLKRVSDGEPRSDPYQLQCEWGPDDRGQSFGVTDIELFATCAYKFFAAKRLRLSVEKSGPDRLDKGNILHEVVQKFLAEVGPAPLYPRDVSIARLEELLDEQLAGLRRDARPYQIRLLRQSLGLLLPAFYDREKEYREYTRLTPRFQEISFGSSRSARADGISPDPGSSPSPLLISGGSAGPISIHGRMDRIDLGEGGAAAVLDYKLGAAKSLADMEAGKSLQIPLYFMAMEQVFNLKVGAAFYDSFDRNERTVLVRHDCIDHILVDRCRANGPKSSGDRSKDRASNALLVGSRFETLLATARDKVVEVADEIAARHIPLTRDDHCKLCDFSDVCRS